MRAALVEEVVAEVEDASHSTKPLLNAYKCHKLGHFQYECLVWDKEANYAELDKEEEMNKEEEMLLMSYVEINEAKRKDAWFLDSGCSNHMCGDKRLFCEFNEGFCHMVKLGNDTRMSVVGKGNVRLQMNGFNYVVT